MEPIKLKLYNFTLQKTNPDIVICLYINSKVIIAWKVIKNLGIGSSHPFSISLQNQISISDSDGNYTKLLDAENGQEFLVLKLLSGNEIELYSSSSSNEICVTNYLPKDNSITMYMHNNSDVFWEKKNISATSYAQFKPEPTKLWIGCLDNIFAGDKINIEQLKNITTEFVVENISNADIVMSGGEEGLTSYKFELKNVESTI